MTFIPRKIFRALDMKFAGLDTIELMSLDRNLLPFTMKDGAK